MWQFNTELQNMHTHTHVSCMWVFHFWFEWILQIILGISHYPSRTYPGNSAGTSSELNSAGWYFRLCHYQRADNAWRYAMHVAVHSWIGYSIQHSHPFPPASLLSSSLFKPSSSLPGKKGLHSIPIFIQGVTWKTAQLFFAIFTNEAAFMLHRVILPTVEQELQLHVKCTSWVQPGDRRPNHCAASAP